VAVIEITAGVMVVTVDPGANLLQRADCVTAQDSRELLDKWARCISCSISHSFDDSS
jgi:hypothetical protein